MLSTAVSSSLTDNCMYQVAEVCDTPVERVQCVACAFFAGFIVSVMLDRDGWRQVGIKRGSAKARRHSPPPPYPPFSPSLISLMVSVDVKPVLNWANVCSPEHTSDTSTNYDSFQLLVRRIWFGQSKLYFILIWLVMRCKLRPELAADAQQTA